MRILILLSAMVTGSMAACAVNDMFVVAGFAAANNDDTYTTSARPQQSVNAVGIQQFFSGRCTLINQISGDDNGGILSVPWPLSTGSYTGSLGAGNFSVSMVFTTDTSSALVTGGSATNAVALGAGEADFFQFTGVASALIMAGATCAKPQFKWYSDACSANSTDLAKPHAAEGWSSLGWNGTSAAASGVATSGLATYGKLVSAGADDLSSSTAWVDETAFTLMHIKFFTDNDCSTAVTKGATKVISWDGAMFDNTDVITATDTTPGRCMNVKKDVSFEFFCDIPGGTVKHVGYSSTNCGTATGTAADTVSWAPIGASTTWTTIGTTCKQWKGVTGLYAALYKGSDRSLIDTDAKLATVCALTTTAAPTAAPASGAAAVGTAAAVAAGAAALIL